MLVDFCKLKRLVGRALAPLDHRDLNQLPWFRKRAPTSETIARWVYDAVASRVNSRTCRVVRVAVREGDDTEAAYIADERTGAPCVSDKGERHTLYD